MYTGNYNIRSIALCLDTSKVYTNLSMYLNFYYTHWFGSIVETKYGHGRHVCLAVRRQALSLHQYVNFHVVLLRWLPRCRIWRSRSKGLVMVERARPIPEQLSAVVYLHVVWRLPFFLLYVQDNKTGCWWTRGPRGFLTITLYYVAFWVYFVYSI